MKHLNALLTLLLIGWCVYTILQRNALKSAVDGLKIKADSIHAVSIQTSEELNRKIDSLALIRISDSMKVAKVKRRIINEIEKHEIERIKIFIQLDSVGVLPEY